MTLNRATAAKANRLSFGRQADNDRAEIARIESDAKYSEEGRAEAIRPIRDRATERHNDYMNRTKTLVDAAQASYNMYRPRESQARAALASPERAAAIRTLATGLPAANLLQMARLAAEKADLPAAYGLRLALNAAAATGSLSEEDAGAVHSALDRIVYPEAEAARAEYLAAKIEYDTLELAGPMNDPIDVINANPVVAIQRARAAAAIEQEDGTLLYLGDNDRAHVQQLAGTMDERQPADAA
jgi:hypothetical protein